MYANQRVVPQDGSVHPVQLRGQVFRDDTGCATHPLGIAIDLTDEVDPLLRLAEQDERQRRLLRRLKLATKTCANDHASTPWKLAMRR